MAAMFPLRRRIDPNLTQMRQLPPDFGKGEPEKLGGGGIVRDESGLRGMFGSKRLPRTLGVIGAGLRQIGGEAPDAINEFVAAEQAERDAQMQRDIFGMRMRSQKMETQQGQDREQLVQEFIASLPAEQQLRARAAYLTSPEGFASQYLSTGSSDWQNNGTIPYRIDPATGQVITGSGTIPHRPRAGDGDDSGNDDGWSYYD